MTGSFAHTSATFTSLEEIKREIQLETDRSTQSKGVSSVPIRLKLRHSSLVDLTLVDLPGEKGNRDDLITF